jgi:hypothetical protein
MLNSGRQRLNCAVEGDIVTFNELNEAQKQSAIKNIWNTRGAGPIYNVFNEQVMEDYHLLVQELAARCNKDVNELLGGDSWEINLDELYWSSNSQGPYPQWKLDKVFGGFTIEYANPKHVVEGHSPSQNGKPAVECIDVNYSHWSDDMDASDYEMDIEYFDSAEGDWVRDYTINADGANMSSYDIPDEVLQTIKQITIELQAFLNDVWALIRETASAYPDDGWAYDLYEANDWGDFEVIDDQTAAYYNDDWDDKIAGVDYY